VSTAYVLDSYAVLALLGGEAGSDVVARLLSSAAKGECELAMTWVNVGEAGYIVERRTGRERWLQVLTMLEATAVDIVDVGRDLSLAAARIKAAHPVAYGDTFAAALASQRRARLVTGDPEIKALEQTVDILWLGSGTP
jgi:predicted nucleic acid-binding protein